MYVPARMRVRSDSLALSDAAGASSCLVPISSAAANSLLITASFSPCALEFKMYYTRHSRNQRAGSGTGTNSTASAIRGFKRTDSKVVLPDPRKPVMTVTGKRFSPALSSWLCPALDALAAIPLKRHNNMG